MDTMTGMYRSQAAIARGDKPMVFDWEKAAHLIKERRPLSAGAGLANDWDWTGGTIYQDGAIVDDEYTYLASLHATPELDMDGEISDCWRYKDETPGWDEGTKWPEIARAIILGQPTLEAEVVTPLLTDGQPTDQATTSKGDSTDA